MAWRSSGVTNAELINNLFGKRAFFYFPIEAKGRMESHFKI